MSAHAERDDELDWFGYSVRKDRDMRPVEPVPCPHCGTAFTTGLAMRTHLVDEHGTRAAKQGTAQEAGRLRRWVQGLAYLPSWFVIPLNLGVTAVLATAWWDDIELFSLDDPTGVAQAWILRLSLLPVTCYLAARVATIERA